MTSVILAEKISKARADHPGDAKRIDAAVAIVAAHLADRSAGIITAKATPEGLVWLVKGSEATPYQVRLEEHAGCSCSCRDFVKRGRVCKHIMAVKLVALAHQPAPTADQVRELRDAVVDQKVAAVASQMRQRRQAREWREEV